MSGVTGIYIQDFIKWFVTSPFNYSVMVLIAVIVFGLSIFLMYKAVYNGQSYVTISGTTKLSFVVLLGIMSWCFDQLLQIMVMMNNSLLFERIDPLFLMNLTLYVHILFVLTYQMGAISVFIGYFKTKKTLD